VFDGTVHHANSIRFAGEQLREQTEKRLCIEYKFLLVSCLFDAPDMHEQEGQGRPHAQARLPHAVHGVARQSPATHSADDKMADGDVPCAGHVTPTPRPLSVRTPRNGTPTPADSGDKRIQIAPEITGMLLNEMVLAIPKSPEPMHLILYWLIDILIRLQSVSVNLYMGVRQTLPPP
jgi:hypothetical protein